MTNDRRKNIGRRGPLRYYSYNKPHRRTGLQDRRVATSQRRKSATGLVRFDSLPVGTEFLYTNKNGATSRYRKFSRSEADKVNGMCRDHSWRPGALVQPLRRGTETQDSTTDLGPGKIYVNGEFVQNVNSFKLTMVQDSNPGLEPGTRTQDSNPGLAPQTPTWRELMQSNANLRSSLNDLYDQNMRLAEELSKAERQLAQKLQKIEGMGQEMNVQQVRMKQVRANLAPIVGPEIWAMDHDAFSKEVEKRFEGGQSSLKSANERAVFWANRTREVEERLQRERDRNRTEVEDLKKKVSTLKDTLLSRPQSGPLPCPRKFEFWHRPHQTGKTTAMLDKAIAAFAEGKEVAIATLPSDQDRLFRDLVERIRTSLVRGNIHHSGYRARTITSLDGGTYIKVVALPKDTNTVERDLQRDYSNKVTLIDHHAAERLLRAEFPRIFSQIDIQS